MLSVFDVADHFLVKQDDESGESITNMKLQKLCYYAQGFHLAIYDEPLFSDDIEAWQYGPVVRSLWDKYKSKGRNPLPVPKNHAPCVPDDEISEFLDEVYDVYGQYSAWKLRDMTHSEPTWQETTKGTGVISQKSMRDYFAMLVDDE